MLQVGQVCEEQFIWLRLPTMLVDEGLPNLLKNPDTFPRSWEWTYQLHQPRPRPTRIPSHRSNSCTSFRCRMGTGRFVKSSSWTWLYPSGMGTLSIFDRTLEVFKFPAPRASRADPLSSVFVEVEALDLAVLDPDLYFGLKTNYVGRLPGARHDVVLRSVSRMRQRRLQIGDSGQVNGVRLMITVSKEDELVPVVLSSTELHDLVKGFGFAGSLHSHHVAPQEIGPVLLCRTGQDIGRREHDVVRGKLKDQGREETDVPEFTGIPTIARADMTEIVPVGDEGLVRNIVST